MGSCWPELLSCPQATSEAAETFTLSGLEVLKQLERRVEAYSGGGSAIRAPARAAPLVRVKKWRVVELAAGSTDAH